MSIYGPSQSGVDGIADRLNRTLQERAVAMLKHYGLSDGFWAEVLLRDVHTINLSPSKRLGYKISQELWSGKTPDYGKLWIFRCEAFALVPKDDRRNLESWSRKCIFLGYGPNRSFGLRLWDPETKQVIRSADVVFNESGMHKVRERPIQLRRVTFSDATPTDGPAMHTRAALRHAAPTATSTATADTKVAARSRGTRK